MNVVSFSELPTEMLHIIFGYDPAAAVMIADSSEGYEYSHYTWISSIRYFFTSELRQECEKHNVSFSPRLKEAAITWYQNRCTRGNLAYKMPKGTVVSAHAFATLYIQSSIAQARNYLHFILTPAMRIKETSNLPREERDDLLDEATNELAPSRASQGSQLSQLRHFFSRKADFLNGLIREHNIPSFAAITSDKETPPSLTLPQRIKHLGPLIVRDFSDMLIYANLQPTASQLAHLRRAFCCQMKQICIT